MDSATSPPATSAVPDPYTKTLANSKVKLKLCKFYASEQGCRNGENCGFAHVEKSPLETRSINSNRKLHRGKPPKKEKTKPAETLVETPQAKELITPQPRNPEPVNSPSRILTPRQPASVRAPVQRPTPAVAENLSPLELELKSLERRFRSSYKVISAAPIVLKSSEKAPSPLRLHQSYTQTTETHPPTIVEFNIQPSDPDFPFDLEFLKLRLIIPTRVLSMLSDTWPSVSSVLHDTRIKVLNREIPENLARIVEVGWRKKLDVFLQMNSPASVSGSQPRRNALAPGQYLLAMINWLDRELEKLLSGLAGDADVVGVTGIVVNNHRTEDELRQNIRDRVNAGFNDINLMVPWTSSSLTANDGGPKNKFFFYGIPVSKNESECESDDTGSGFDEADTESLVSKPTSVLDEFDVGEASLVEKPESLNSASTEQRGTQIRLLEHSLNAISLLECVSPKFLLSCIRCKSKFDSPHNLLPNIINTRPCPQCSTILSITYRPSFVHMSSNTVGYLDLDGYTVLDFLPSAWRVTCEACDQVFGNVGVLRSLPRSDVELKIGCIRCHARMGIKINEVKFIRLLPSVVNQSPAPPKMALKAANKKRAAEEGIILGDPLPKTGSCGHYRKSYRWFRFPCCSRVYPCDLCHEECKNDGHEMQWATRMICGFCSREQAYSQQAMCICGKELTRRSGRGGGFWEGGQGTRSQTLMSKKDPRKHKGMGKTSSTKSSRVGKKP